MYVDFNFENHGSTWLVRPTSAAARKHLANGVSEEAQWFGGALAVEPRYIESLAQRLQDEGYEVSL